MRNKQLLFGLFILVSSLNIWAKINGLGSIAAGSKLLIIPALIALVFSDGKPAKKYIIALLFSWIGDALLIPEGTSFFIGGIAAFWVTQLLYCSLILSKLNGTLLQQFSKSSALTPLLLVATYLGSTLFLLFPKLNTLLVPVCLYAITLSMTGFLGVLLWVEAKTKTTIYLATGCLLFVLSDSMIAFDAFYFSEVFFTHWIMITYVPAQFLISLSLGKSR